MTARPSDFKRPAIFFLNRLGDQLIALPAIRALCALFPGGLQLLLGEGMVSFFYRGLPVSEPVRLWWDDYDKESIDVARVARSASSCDLLICLSSPFSYAVEIARRLGASWTVGCSEVFDDHVHAESGVNEFDRLFAIPRHIDPSLRLEHFSAPPVFSPAAESAASRYFSANCNLGTRLLFVHPETKPERTWARERMAWVIEHFLAKRPEYMVVVSTLAPFELALQDRRVISIEEHLELRFALLKRSDLFLGLDSCFLHAADLCRIPGVGLFGPSDPTRWGFRLSRSFRHIKEESMDKIHPGAVLDALLELAEQTEQVCQASQNDKSVERHNPIAF